LIDVLALTTVVYGFGVVLAQSAIERVGGSLAFSTRHGGGTVVQVRLPLASIAAG